MINVAIVGAGPYGLSVAAHLKNKGISFRIFGRPMDSWLNHMPKGVAAIYNRARYADEVKAAFAAWSRHIESLLTEKARAATA